MRAAKRNKSAANPRRSKNLRQKGRRRGNILVLSAFLMIGMMGILALTVDVGYVLKVQTDLDRAVDAAALAGAGMLVEGEEEAQLYAVEYLVRNPAGFQVIVDEENLEQRVAEFLETHEDNLETTMGHWDPDAVDEYGNQGAMQTGVQRPSAIHVSLTHNNHPYFFARIFGNDLFSVHSEAIATYQPRDMVLVLDYSGSMNDDSEFKSFGTIGQAEVEANLLECWEDLGPPAYGNNRFKFQPRWAKQKGAAANGNIPQITTTYKDTKVHVKSTMMIDTVTLKFSNGLTQTFLNVNTDKKNFSGTGINQGKRIYHVWVVSADNQLVHGIHGEHHEWTPSVMTEKVLDWFALDNEPWPYASGSWEDFVEYCYDYNNQNDDAGYRWKYGGMNLVNYWLDRKPRHSQTADLWQVSAQPVTAVKNAVDLFIDYIQEVDTEDRLGLSVYNSSSGVGLLEEGLTTDLDLIGNLARERQAAHYHNYTNISGGMSKARVELTNNARTGAYRLMVLMTDGKANWTSGGYSTSQAYQNVLNEAQLAAELNIKIMTISLGAGADTSLMQQVADITDGTHFNIPGGQTVAEYEDDLVNVFHTIAGDRPLKIVK